MKLTQQDIENLITVGKINGEFENWSLYYFKSRDYINRQHGNIWRELVKILSDQDLIFVFKALVRIERKLEWIGGSVAGAIWVYSVIQNRDLDRDFKIADFGLRNCDNPWVPFGGSYYGVRTIENYFAFKKTSSEESQRKAIEYEKTLSRVKGRKERRSAQIAELRKLINEDRGNIKKELLNKYQNASNLEKLKLIANDQLYPPEYYPNDWINITIEEVEKLPLKLIKQLYDKLSTKTKGEWKRFAKKLERYEDGK
jgi:hypothetical protein